MATLCLVMSIWIVITTIMEIRQRIAPQGRGDKAQGVLTSLSSLSRSHWGMVTGHLGFAVALIGISLVSAYEQERQVRMAYGDAVTLQSYEFVLNSVDKLQGANYSADVGHVDVFEGGKLVAKLHPEKRFYPVQQSSMTEAGIDTSIGRDLFVALGEQMKNGDWALRLYVKPFVAWIWVGAFIMAFGGVLSISDKRYRMAKLAAKKAKPKSNNEAKVGDDKLVEGIS
jgi:cytochrome c-type biogenesis protein CcmF